MAAPFTAQSSGRNAMIQKIHVARRMLALDDDTYRALLVRVTKKSSCADMNENHLRAVLDEFKALGFTAKKSRAGARKLANTDQAVKIRALWLNLYHLGEVHDPSEHSLSNFVKRTCAIDDLRWLTPKHADQAIRALRGWLSRIGLTHPTAAQISALYEYRVSRLGEQSEETAGLAAKLLVIHLQYKRLRATEIPDEPELLSGEEMDQLMEKLGALLRQ